MIKLLYHFSTHVLKSSSLPSDMINILKCCDHYGYYHSNISSYPSFMDDHVTDIGLRILA